MKHQTDRFYPDGNPWRIRIRNACLLFWAGLRDTLRVRVVVAAGAHQFTFPRVLYNPTMRIYLTAGQLKILFSAQDRHGEITYGDKVFTTREIAALIDGVTAAKSIQEECPDATEVDVLPEHLR